MAMSMAPAATTTDPDPTGSKPNGHVTLRLLRPGLTRAGAARA